MKKILGFVEGTIFATLVMGLVYLIFLVIGLIGWDDGQKKLKELCGDFTI